MTGTGKSRHPRHGTTLDSFLESEGDLQEFRTAAQSGGEMKQGLCVGGPLHGQMRAVLHGSRFVVPVRPALTGRAWDAETDVTPVAIVTCTYLWCEANRLWRYEPMSEGEFRLRLAELRAGQSTYAWEP